MGLDFAGPLYIVDGKPKSKETFKVHILPLTCTSMRGLHFELTRGLTTEAFLMAFRRFASRRVSPATSIRTTQRRSSQHVRTFEVLNEPKKFGNKLFLNELYMKSYFRKGPLVRLLLGTTCTWPKTTTEENSRRSHKWILNNCVLSYQKSKVPSSLGVITCVYDGQESIPHPLTPSDLIYVYGRNSDLYEVLTKR